MATTDSGLVHCGLRYSAYLRGISPDAYVLIRRNNSDDENGYKKIKQGAPPAKIFGFVVGPPIRSLAEIVELAVAKLREYDAVVETFAPEPEEET